MRHAVFVPFAAVALPWPECGKRVSDATGLALHSVEELEKADLVVLGGGNTFQLLRECRQRNLLQSISRRVRQKKAKYLGWSAGLDALGLIAFQINAVELHGGKPANWFDGEKAPMSLRPISSYQAGTWRGLASSNAAYEAKPLDSTRR